MSRKSCLSSLRLAQYRHPRSPVLLLGGLVTTLFNAPLSLADVSGVVSQEISAASAETAAAAAAKRPDGWQNKLSVGGTLMFGTSNNVAGNADGITLQISLLTNGTADYRKGPHSWVTTGSLNYAQTRTPVVPVFLKSNDLLDIKSTYALATKIQWLGPFARASLNTAMFPGYEVRATDVEIIRQLADGTVSEPELLIAGDFLPTTGNFEPLSLKQVVGLQAKPLDKPELKLGIHLGAGAEEVITQKGFVVNDDKATAALEVKQLSDYTNVGAELEVNAEGVVNSLVSWNAGVTLFQPVYSSSSQGLTGIELLNVDSSAKVSVKLAKWASLDYTVTAKKQPQVVDKWQIQTGLLLTTAFNLVGGE